MSDTTVKIDTETRDRFAALAAARGMSMRAYLAELAVTEENQARLNRATAAFEAAITRPGFAEAFERDFGAPSARTSPRTSQRAA
ncbi:antitoxin MazE7 [Streptomyces gamaensis]|uniref:Antitoxin MazE7 n=1 Tax=Streptomyces gamaensis TaxID=1763542 RepID=A0ABW0YXX0_9ACTN